MGDSPKIDCNHHYFYSVAQCQFKMVRNNMGHIKVRYWNTGDIFFVLNCSNQDVWEYYASWQGQKMEYR